MSKFLESMRQIQEEYDVDDDSMKEALEIFVRSRGKEYFDRLVKKYGFDLVQKSFDYVGDIPKIQWQNKSPEGWVYLYALNNRKELSSKELKLFFDSDGKPKKPLHNIFDDPVDLERVEVEEKEGKFWTKEKPIEKPKPPKVKMPSEAKIKQMTSKDLWKLIQEAEAKGLEE